MTDASPRDVLWRPTPESIAATRVGRFRDEVERRRGIELPDYEALWRWSVEELEAFWLELWHHFDVIGELGDAPVLADRSMPGAVVVPRRPAQLRRERPARAATTRSSSLAHSQTRPAHAVTRGELRDQVARARAGLRRLGRGTGRPRRRLPAQHPRGARRDARHRQPRRDLAVLRARVRRPQRPRPLPADSTRRCSSRSTATATAIKVIDRSDEVAAIRAGLPTLARDGRRPVPRHRTASADLPGTSCSPSRPTPAYDRVGVRSPLVDPVLSPGPPACPRRSCTPTAASRWSTSSRWRCSTTSDPGDRYLVYATTSWVMWNIMVSGLLAGAALVLLDGDPHHPDALELWRMVDGPGSTTSALGASFLLRAQARARRRGRCSTCPSLRASRPPGSPLPAEGFRWVYEHVSPTAFLQSGQRRHGRVHRGSSAAARSCRCTPARSPAAARRRRRRPSTPRAARWSAGSASSSSPSPCRRCRCASGTTPTASATGPATSTTYPGVWRHGDWITFNARGGCRHHRPLRRDAQPRRRPDGHERVLPASSGRRDRRQPRGPPRGSRGRPRRAAAVRPAGAAEADAR